MAKSATVRYPVSSVSNLESNVSLEDVNRDIDRTFNAIKSMARVYETRRVLAVKQNNDSKAKEYQLKLDALDKHAKQLIDTYLETKLLGDAARDLPQHITPSKGLDELTPQNYAQYNMTKPQVVLKKEYKKQKLELRKPQVEKFAEGKNGKCYQLYKKFRQEIHRASGENRMMPDPARYLAGYQADDDLEIEEERKSYKCPLTGSLFENPVKNPCGHVFSKAAILDYVRQRRHELQTGEDLVCPVAGCTYNIEETRLEEDQTTAEEVEEYKQLMAQEATQANAGLEQL